MNQENLVKIWNIAHRVNNGNRYQLDINIYKGSFNVWVHDTEKDKYTVHYDLIDGLGCYRDEYDGEAVNGTTLPDVAAMISELEEYAHD